MKRALVAALATVACGPPTVDVSLPAEGIVLLASVDASGRVVDTAIVDAGSGAAELAAPPGGSLVTWSLEDGQLAGDSIRFVPVDESREGCDRCSVPVHHPPQQLLPGDACPPPPFAAVAVYDEHGEDGDPAIAVRIRDTVRIVHDGACAFPIDEGEGWVGTPPSFVPVWPASGPVETPTFGLTADGLAAGVSAGWTWWRPAGEDVHITAQNAVYPGPVTIFAPIGGDRFLVGHRGAPYFMAPNAYLILAPDRATVPVSGATLPGFYARELAVDVDGTVLMNGYDRELNPASEFQRCTGAGDALTCVRDSIDCEIGLVRLEVVDNGTAIAVAEDGRIAVRPRGASSWRCDSAGGLPTAGGPESLSPSIRAGHVGDRLILCTGRDGLASSAVYHATIPAFGPDDDPTGRITFTRTTTVSSTCFDVVPSPEAPDAVVVWMFSGGLVVDGDGNVVRSLAFGLNDLVPSAPVSVGEIATFRWAGEWMAYMDRDGRVFRRRGTGAFEPAYGHTVSGSGPLVDAADGTVVGYDPQSPVVIAPGDTTTPEWLRVGFDPDRPAQAATRLLDGRHLVATDRALHLVDFEAEAIVTEELARSHRAVGIAAMTQRLVLIAQTLHLEVLDLETLEATTIEVEYDDPRTEIVETGPERRSPWRAVEAKGGVAWAATAGRLVRVVPDGLGSLRAEGWWAPPPQAGIRTFALVAPDELIVAVADGIENQGWRVTQDGSGSFVFVEDRAFEGLASSSSALTVAIAIAGRRITFLTSHGEAFRPSAPRRVAPVYGIEHAVATDGFLVVGGLGRFAVAPDE